MDWNHLNNFERGPNKDHCCEVWSNSNQQFRRRCHFQKSFTDGRMHPWMDARWTKCDHKSSPCHYVTGELKIKMLSAAVVIGAGRVNQGSEEFDWSNINKHVVESL